MTQSVLQAAKAQVESIVLALIVAVSILAALIRFHYRAKARSFLPPSPPINNIIFGHSIPNHDAFRKFEEWATQYGPIFSLRQGFTTIIVVARYQAAVEIMEREGAHLADRPTSISAGETVSGGNRLLLIPVGDRFKKMRRVLHTHLQPKVVRTYTHMLMKNAKRHALDILDKPEVHHEHAKRYSAAVTLAIAYGKAAGGHDDPEVVAVNHCLIRLGSALRPCVWKVDFYPWLRYVPGYLRELQDVHEQELQVFKNHIEDVRRTIAHGKPTPPSFAKYLLSQQESLQFSDDETAYLAAALFGTDGDTTASAISVSILAAAFYPEAQRKVQEELDIVIGRDRAPTFADEDDLPQLQAFILETFRWYPVAGSGGFAHRATKDIAWKGYVIPKGATVIGNIWSIGRDPVVFPNPERFDPQRWLTCEGRIRDDLKLYTFGFGRRVCPGQYLASASVFINTVLVLWLFNIQAHPNDKAAFLPGITKVNFAQRLGKRSREEIREMLREYGNDG